MEEFFSFKKMITPGLIRVLFFLGLLLILVGCFWALVMGPDAANRVGALVGFVVLPLLWRIYCELMIVMFSIHERLGEITDAVKRNKMPE